ncbi:MAG: hypothetical protein ABFD92_11640 [Planctomycetaceae bacterium]|nr:hypothetical protein [Planctomycetaceae bacterium]
MLFLGTNIRGLLIILCSSLPAASVLGIGLSLAHRRHEGMIVLISCWTFALIAGALAQVTDDLSPRHEPVARYRSMRLTWIPTWAMFVVLAFWLCRVNFEIKEGSKAHLYLLVSLGIWSLSLLLQYLIRRRRRAAQPWAQEVEP